ncbi:MAG: hypothetical protein QOG30_2980, partial [Acidimicrobiaceae bacterium]
MLLRASPKRGRKWTAQLYPGRDPGTGRKRYKQLTGFPTKHAAGDALTEHLERLRVGDFAEPGVVTTASFYSRWLAAVEPTVRATTLTSYR